MWDRNSPKEITIQTESKFTHRIIYIQRKYIYWRKNEEERETFRISVIKTIINEWASAMSERRYDMNSIGRRGRGDQL